jgi:hypothetical protein
VTAEIWRDLTCKSPYWGNDKLKDPIQHARMRFEQNIAAGLNECGYQRQTGRTFRTLLRALQAIENRKTVLILVSRSAQVGNLHSQLVEWIEESCTNRASFKVSRDTKTSKLSIRHVRDQKEKKIVATVTHLHLGISKELPINYDLVLTDNVITDEAMLGFSTEDVLESLHGIEHQCLTHGSLSSEVKSFSDGLQWKEGDLFQLPKSLTIGTMVTINRVGCIPISLTVLYEGNLLELPWDTCDIFHRISSSS